MVEIRIILDRDIIYIMGEPGMLLNISCGNQALTNKSGRINCSIIVALLAGLTWMTAPAAADAYQYGFNCGGARKLTPLDGAVYEIDRLYTVENGAGRFGGKQTAEGWLAEDVGGLIPGVQLKKMVTTRVDGWEEYRFDLPNGRYLVSMHFVEWDKHWRGLREFHIAAEGEILVDSLDIYRRVDRLYALNLRRIIEVTDGQLNINPVFITGAPMINSIHVEEVAVGGSAPPVPEGLSAIAGYGEVILTWTPYYERTDLGVEVFRKDLTSGGEEVEITGDPIAAVCFVDRGLDPDHEYQYRLVAVSGGGVASSPSPPITVSPIRSGESPLQVFGYEMSEEYLTYLNVYRSRNDYLPADFHTLYDDWPDIGLRYRGNTTRNLPKKSHKIRLDPPFYNGHVKLNLQAEWTDKSMIREKMSYDVMNGTGCLSGLAEFIHLERNDVFAGIFTMAEQVDEHFLENRGRTGTIWKAIDGDFSKRPEISRYYSGYELEYGTYEDFERLAEFIETTNDSPDGIFLTEVLDYLDVDGFFNYYAGQAIIANFDFTGWNYYLYMDSETGLFEFIPWDLNESWSDVGQALDICTRDHPVLLFFWNRLYTRLMETPQYRRMFAVRVEELLNDPFILPVVHDMIDREYTLLAPEAERDIMKYGREDMTKFLNERGKLEQFAENRRNNIFSQLETFAPDPNVNLFINELLRLNVTGAVDEYWEHEPWVEICNFGNETIPLGGLWLSDDPGDPFKWQIPAGVNIGEKEFLVFWLDGEPGEGELHASFRVEPGTGFIGLFDSQGDPVNYLEISFPALPDMPVVRTPDCCAITAPAAYPTFGAANDSPPIANIHLETPYEVLTGDTLSMLVYVWNNREFGADCAIELKAGYGEYLQTIKVIPFHLDGWGSFTETVRIHVPSGLPAVGVTIYANLTVPGLTVLDQVSKKVFLRDHRPVPLLVNEIMADNDTTWLDENDQYDDWFEIYNPSGRTVSLGGLYLSDDAAEPRKWKFLEGGQIPPGGHLVVWCDDDVEQGVFHTNFKLGAGGEEIGIYDLDIRGNMVIDRIVFPDLHDDLVYGRTPDGGDDITFLPYATPGEANPG